MTDLCFFFFFLPALAQLRSRVLNLGQTSEEYGLYFTHMKNFNLDFWWYFQEKIWLHRGTIQDGNKIMFFIHISIHISFLDHHLPSLGPMNQYFISYYYGVSNNFTVFLSFWIKSLNLLNMYLKYSKMLEPGVIDCSVLLLKSIAN
jgi:hypothetical protein